MRITRVCVRVCVLREHVIIIQCICNCKLNHCNNDSFELYIL